MENNGGKYNLQPAVDKYVFYIPWKNVKQYDYRNNYIVNINDDYVECGAELPLESFNLLKLKDHNMRYGFDIISNIELSDSSYNGFKRIDALISTDISKDCQEGIIIPHININAYYYPRIIFESTIYHNYDYYGIRFYASKKFIDSYNINDLILYSTLT